MVKTAEPVPAAAPSSAAALPRRSFANLAVHPPAARADRGNLPGPLRSGIETLSGVSMDGVRVHYDSPRPADLDAHAFAQGREIHLAPGQDDHLPHEAWHLVQQAQGRVKPTLQAKGGPPINEDKTLEREADAMGAKAMAQGARPADRPLAAPPAARAAPAQLMAAAPIQLGKKKKGNQRPAPYIIGQHGAKKKEQKRLSEEFGIKVTGTTHESEHGFGFEPLNRSSGEKRGKTSRARKLENQAPAYQEVKELHREHIGTDTHSAADESGFNSESYRDYQRELLESDDPSTAMQLNQLAYSFNPSFGSALQTPQGEAATESFNTMVTNMSNVTYAQNDSEVDVPVTTEDKAEMILSRMAAQSGKFPSTQEEEDVLEKLMNEENK